MILFPATERPLTHYFCIFWDTYPIVRQLTFGKETHRGRQLAKWWQITPTETKRRAVLRRQMDFWHSSITSRINWRQCLVADGTATTKLFTTPEHVNFACVSVFAPSAKCLEQLLEIYSDFAVSRNVVFNVNKSQCLIINSRHDLIGHPLFHLSGAPLPYTDCYKYLGQLINSSLSDDANRPGLCTLDPTWLFVNLHLHHWVQKLCCLMRIVHLYYGCPLWCSMYQYY